MRDNHAARTADETWIPRFAAEGGNAILSADRNILVRPNQLKALAESKLVAVFLSAKWASSRRHIQAAHVLHCWPRIEKVIEQSQPSQCWRVPFGFDDAPIELIQIDLAKVASGLA